MMGLISFLLEENVEGVTSSSNGIFAGAQAGNCLGSIYMWSCSFLQLTWEGAESLSASVLPSEEMFNDYSGSCKDTIEKIYDDAKPIKPQINLATKIIPGNQTFHFHVS